MSAINKLCAKCQVIKNSDLFYGDRSKKDGLSSYCKQCRIEHSHKYSKENFEKISETNKKRYLERREEYLKKFKEYRLRNPEKVRQQEKSYRVKNREKYREKQRKSKQKMMKTNPIFKLKENLRKRTYNSLKAKSFIKLLKFDEYIGCTGQELKIHIEKQFQPGMSWENYSYHVWQIDHIIPLAQAKNTEELYKLCHYTNLQPLWKKDHLRKTISDMRNICQ